METIMHHKRTYRAALGFSLLLAACGDGGASGYGSSDDSASGYDAPAPTVKRDASTPSSSLRDAGARDDQAPEVADAGSGDATVNGALADLALRSGAAFQNYLVDREGRPLYFFANDVPGSSASACTGACLDKWPVFDVKEISVGDGIAKADVSRFLRADGAWQTTFKGRPLYYFASDTAGSGVGGDGVGGRWFVARDYTVFVAAKTDLVPDNASAAAPYMTNRAGRTVYAFKNDTKGSAGGAPISACNDACLDAWPVWKTPGALADLVLPSNMKSADFAQFQRTVAGASVEQLTYRGWPLYFHTPDDMPGETSGHLSGAWRAIDPASFAQPAAAGDAGVAGDAGAASDGGAKSDGGVKSGGGY
jgi:predicted lipoprotein with Yx(FWY)xxD motif